MRTPADRIGFVSDEAFLEHVQRKKLEDRDAPRFQTVKSFGRVTLDDSGVSQITFNPPIIMDRQPYVVLTPHVNADSSGLVAANVVTSSYTQDVDGKYTGCTIVAARVTKKLPVVTLLSELSGLKITDRDSVGGEVCDWMAF